MIKKTIALLLAAALMLGAACAEPASEGGAFAVLARDDGADPRLTALEETAEPVNAALTLSSGMTVEICQAYYEGYRVYVSYRISPVTDLMKLHEGAPEAVTEWDQVVEDWVTGDFPAVYPDIKKQNDWLDGKGQRWLEIPYCGLMDGLTLEDGVYADIIAGTESREPDGTIIGWKECIVPEEAQADTLTFIAEIAYGTTIKFQDYTTLKEKFGDPERTEIRFTLARNHTFRHLRGETAQAVAELTMGQLDITGVVRLVSPEQAASWTAWQNGEDSGGVDVIVCWNLYQNGELVSQDLYGASSVPETGEGVVFDVMYPRMDNLSGLTLVPEYAEAGEKPEEAITLTK